MGLEPTTSAMPLRRANQLRHGPEQWAENHKEFFIFSCPSGFYPVDNRQFQGELSQFLP